MVLRQDGEEMWSRLMLARAEYDQTVGAMTRAQVLTAYAWDAAAGDLVPVWQMTVASESVFNGDDELARADLQPEMARKVKGWVRLASAASHRFVVGGSGGVVGGVAGAVPHVQVASAQEVHSYIQADDTFVSLAKRTVNQAFVWSQKWKHFILTEARWDGRARRRTHIPVRRKGSRWRRARRWPCWNRSASAWRGSGLGHLI